MQMYMCESEYGYLLPVDLQGSFITLGMRPDMERIIVSLLIPSWMDGLESCCHHISYHSNKVQHFVQSFSYILNPSLSGNY